MSAPICQVLEAATDFGRDGICLDVTLHKGVSYRFAFDRDQALDVATGLVKALLFSADSGKRGENLLPVAKGVLLALQQAPAKRVKIGVDSANRPVTGTIASAPSKRKGKAGK